MNRKNIAGSFAFFFVVFITVMIFTACSSRSEASNRSAEDPALMSGDSHTESESSPGRPLELHIGSSLSGNLDYGQEIWYSVKTDGEGFLTVEAYSEIDTFLTAFDAHNNYITENDDWDGMNPRIEFIAHPNTSYLFRYNAFSSSSSGSFRISASLKPLPSFIELRSGPHNGFIESNQEYWYRILISQTGVLNIHTTGGADTYLEAYNRNYDLLSTDDDSGENLNAMIKMDVKAGEIYIFKLRASGGSSGSYTIVSNISAYPAPTQLASGSFLDRYIEAGDEHWFAVRVTEGDFLAVWTEGGTDTILDAYTSSYEHIANHDDTWYDDIVNRNASLSLPIWDVSAGVVYIFKLRSFNSGSYRILVSMGYAQG